MQIVPAVAVECLASREVLCLLIPGPEPGVVFFRTMGFFPPILFPFDIRRFSQDTCIFRLCTKRSSSHERTNVQPDSIIDIGLPPDGLMMQRFPAHKDVVRRFAFEDLLQFILQMKRSG